MDGLHDDAPRPETARRRRDEWHQRAILKTLDVDLHSVDSVNPSSSDDMSQGLHVDLELGSSPQGHGGLAIVARIDIEVGSPGSFSDGALEDRHVAKTIGGNVETQAPDHFRDGLDGHHVPACTHTIRRESCEDSAVRPDVNKHVPRLQAINHLRQTNTPSIDTMSQDVCLGTVVTKVDTQFNPAYPDAVCFSDQGS